MVAQCSPGSGLGKGSGVKGQWLSSSYFVVIVPLSLRSQDSPVMLGRAQWRVTIFQSHISLSFVGTPVSHTEAAVR